MIFVQGLFDLYRDHELFMAHVRDFLIQLREVSGDNTELFHEELELEQERKRRAEQDVAMRIPGLVKPSELPDNDELED